VEGGGLKESDAWPAQPQDAYGLEKLATEELAMHYNKDFGLETRIGRFHNIYGPHGTWKGGREKAPAAFCRKVRAGGRASASAGARGRRLGQSPAARAAPWPGAPLSDTARFSPPPPPQVLTSANEIEMWGDGKQTRSFTYIDDCVEGVLRITKSDFRFGAASA
jgi:GDP-D-mannose 3',5'-epimerase